MYNVILFTNIMSCKSCKEWLSSCLLIVIFTNTESAKWYGNNPKATLKRESKKKITLKCIASLKSQIKWIKFLIWPVPTRKIYNSLSCSSTSSVSCMRVTDAAWKLLHKRVSSPAPSLSVSAGCYCKVFIWLEICENSTVCLTLHDKYKRADRSKDALLYNCFYSTLIQFVHLMLHILILGQYHL